MILVKLHITFGLAHFPISNLALQIQATQCVENLLVQDPNQLRATFAWLNIPETMGPRTMSLRRSR